MGLLECVYVHLACIGTPWSVYVHPGVFMYILRCLRTLWSWLLQSAPISFSGKPHHDVIVIQLAKTVGSTVIKSLIDVDPMVIAILELKTAPARAASHELALVSAASRRHTGIKGPKAAAHAQRGPSHLHYMRTFRDVVKCSSPPGDRLCAR